MAISKIFVTTTGHASSVSFSDLENGVVLQHPTQRFELSLYDTVNNILAATTFLNAVSNRDIIATDELGVPVDAATVLNIVGDIDCNANPNYPAATKGESYRVSVAGKVGGSSGDVVQVGDLIQCLTSTIAGTKAQVGTNWLIIQGNVLASSETVAGYIEIATDAETHTGTDDGRAVTPLKLVTEIAANEGLIAKNIVTLKKTIGFPGDTGKDFTWTSADDTTEQNLDLGAIIPAKARVIDAAVICDQAINTGAIDLALGNASSGEQFIASANCDATTDILSIATGAAFAVAPSLTASHVWVQATKTGNWSGMTAGRHSVYVSYIDNAALD